MTTYEEWVEIEHLRLDIALAQPRTPAMQAALNDLKRQSDVLRKKMGRKRT